MPGSLPPCSQVRVAHTPGRVVTEQAQGRIAASEEDPGRASRACVRGLRRRRQARGVVGSRRIHRPDLAARRTRRRPVPNHDAAAGGRGVPPQRRISRGRSSPSSRLHVRLGRAGSRRSGDGGHADVRAVGGGHPVSCSTTARSRPTPATNCTARAGPRRSSGLNEPLRSDRRYVAPVVSVRPFEPRDADACRQLWVELTEWHRRVFDSPEIGGDDPGSAFDEHLAKIGAENLGGRARG